MDTYRCTASAFGVRAEADVQITEDGILLQGWKNGFLAFADILDIRLLNYHLFLQMRDQTAELSQLGYQTEDFFEKLWQAYNLKCRKALFVEESPAFDAEGDYAYSEPEAQARSIAKIQLFSDCLCLFPHDLGARRVPLCFSSAPVRTGFAIDLGLDTGECYRVGRLGHNTEPFYTDLTDAWQCTVLQWNRAHSALAENLAERLGPSKSAWDTFGESGAMPAFGLFSPQDPAFWFARAEKGRAAVELVAGEQAATYLYRFDMTPETFVLRLRHAMEAMNTHRRLIYLSEEELKAEPLLRMSAERSMHVRFLRGCSAGRVIHTSGWADRIREFFRD